MQACEACGQTLGSLRWRNPIGGQPIPVRVHRAGPVICCREYRRGVPQGYIVDRRQTCLDCGHELVRGRWAAFFLEGALVREFGVGNLAPILNYAQVDHDNPRCRPETSDSPRRRMEQSSTGAVVNGEARRRR